MAGAPMLARWTYVDLEPYLMHNNGGIRRQNESLNHLLCLHRTWTQREINIHCFPALFMGPDTGVYDPCGHLIQGPDLIQCFCILLLLLVHSWHDNRLLLMISIP